MKVKQHHWLDYAIELYVLAFGCITLDWGESRFYIIANHGLDYCRLSDCKPVEHVLRFWQGDTVVHGESFRMTCLPVCDPRELHDANLICRCIAVRFIRDWSLWE